MGMDEYYAEDMDLLDEQLFERQEAYVVVEERPEGRSVRIMDSVYGFRITELALD